MVIDRLLSAVELDTCALWDCEGKESNRPFHSIPWEGGTDQPTGGELSGCYQLRSRLGTAVPSHHSGLAASFSDLVPDQDNPSSSWENNRENN